MDAAIITTYRCPMRCKMCNIWDSPTKLSEEFKPELLEKLPHLDGVNITGGEPFIREDIEDIVKILLKGIIHVQEFKRRSCKGRAE